MAFIFLSPMFLSAFRLRLRRPPRCVSAFNLRTLLIVQELRAARRRRCLPAQGCHAQDHGRP